MANKGFLARAHSILLLGGCIYAVVVLLLFIPFIQTHVVYLNSVRIPWGAEFNAPEKYGLAPGKTSNFYLQTSDNITLGAWFVLADKFHRKIASPPIYKPTDLNSQIPVALKTHPTILFFHGNAATRAFHVRVMHYSQFSSRLDANVLAIDYRGFGDSEGVPSEQGLARDARAAWDWLVHPDQGARAEDILIVGHSLGTAVATKLGVELAQHGITPKGVVLMSPFSSIKNILHTYALFGYFPLMKPLAVIPGATNLVLKRLIHRFDTLSAIEGIKVPLLITHAEDDWDISYSNSEDLFNAFIESHLPPLPALPTNPAAYTPDDWAIFTSAQQKRLAARREIVSQITIQDFGQLEEIDDNGRKVALLKTLKGGHDRLGIQEGVQDIMGVMFGFP